MTSSQSTALARAIPIFALCLVGCGQPPLTDSLGRISIADATAESATYDAASSSDDGSGPYTDDGPGPILGPILDPAAPGDACSPVTACPSGFKCGRHVDPCSGKTVSCGDPCAAGSVCVRDPNDPASQTCQPKACAGRCGAIGLDGCGVPVVCGGCPAGQDCVANQCVAALPPSAGVAGQCAPPTCTPDSQTHLCGSVTNGCGHTLACSCPAGETCSGGLCGAPAPECTLADGGARCGSAPNACGSANVTCGACPGGQCVQGTCKACDPLSCGKATCGRLSNACGESLNCGTCDSGTCYEGQCCNPSTCAELSDGGPMDCAPVNLGCGVTKSCAPCGEGEVCTNHACVACAPKSCSDFGSAGCGHPDGCGKTVSCCAEGTICQGSICCAPGEVAYGGSCCLPSCDPTQPPGPQVSCGQVILCAPGMKGPPR